MSAGTLSVQEFLAIPELEHNPLVNRVVHTFDTDKSGEVDFREFVSSLSVFATHEAEGKEQKYKCNTQLTVTQTTETCNARPPSPMQCAYERETESDKVLSHATKRMRRVLSVCTAFSFLLC